MLILYVLVLLRYIVAIAEDLTPSSGFALRSRGNCSGGKSCGQSFGIFQACCPTAATCSEQYNDVCCPNGQCLTRKKIRIHIRSSSWLIKPQRISTAPIPSTPALDARILHGLCATTTAISVASRVISATPLIMDPPTDAAIWATSSSKESTQSLRFHRRRLRHQHPPQLQPLQRAVQSNHLADLRQQIRLR